MRGGGGSAWRSRKGIHDLGVVRVAQVVNEFMSSDYDAQIMTPTGLVRMGYVVTSLSSTLSLTLTLLLPSPAAQRSNPEQL